MGTENTGRIQSRPNAQRNLGSTVTGLRETGLETERDGLLYVPENYNPQKPAALIVALHAAGGTARQGLAVFKNFADKTGTVVLAPQSQKSNWDALSGRFGKDVFFINEGLMDVFALYRIDPKRVAVAGVQEGAAYAVLLAAANADLFSHVMAFSPTNQDIGAVRICPPLFIARGKDTPELSMIPALRNAHASIELVEFDGGTSTPLEVTQTAFTWFATSGGLDSAAPSAAKAASRAPAQSNKHLS